MAERTRKTGSRVRTPRAKSPRRSRWETVYLETRRRILTLELPPGSPLSEVAVAREFGTSATPARDALGRLRQEGLVVVGPGRRYSVAGLSISDVAQLAEIRYVLECGIVSLAISRQTAEGLARVRAVVEELEEPDLTTAELIARSQAFHVAVAELSGNVRLVDAFRRVLEDSLRVFHLGISATPVAEMVQAHRDLVDAIERGDEATAIAISREEAYGAGERAVGQVMRNGAAAGRYLAMTPSVSEAHST